MKAAEPCLVEANRPRIASENWPEQLVTKQDVIAMLKVSLRSVDRRVAEGKLHRVMVGCCVRFRLSEVLAIMKGEA